MTATADASALADELAAVADAHAGRYHPPDTGNGYRRAWITERVRLGYDADDTSAIVLGSILVRRIKATP